MSGARNGEGNSTRPQRGKGGGRAAIQAAIAAAPIVKTAFEIPPGFEMRADGLWRVQESKAPFRVCGPFEVGAEARGEDTSNGWGLWLRWRNRDGELVSWIMPHALLAGDAAEVRARLAGGGLYVSGTDAGRAALRHFLSEVRVKARVRTVRRTGWYDAAPSGAAFVYAGRVFGRVPGETLMLDIDPPPKVYRPRGTLDGWRNGVAAPAGGNSRMVFAIAFGFAAPLLALTGEEGGCVHLRGGSSQGKTTAAKIAASLYGAPTGPRAYIRKWRATDNGLEGIALEHSDCALVMDEIGQADPKVVGPAAYMLADGQGKGRSRASGGLREVATWRVLVLSTGEVNLSDYAARAAYVVKPGQEVRFLDLPIDAGAGFGGFETPTSKEDADVLAKALEAGAVAHHGTAAPAFIEWLAERAAAEPAWLPDVWASHLAHFLKAEVPAGADGQVRRAARRFALASLAGELATEAGITGWRPGEAQGAAVVCFRAWLDQRGTAGGREAQQIADALRRFISEHSTSRFESLHDEKREKPPGDADGGQNAPALKDGRVVVRQAGFRWSENDEKGEPHWVYGIFPPVFEAELCRPLGMTAKEAREKLAEAALIRVEQRKGEGFRRTLIRRRVPGLGRPELVTVESAIWGTNDGDGGAG